MYKQLLPFIVILQLSTQSHAIDLNNTIEIISQASEATENIQGEINAVITEVPTVETSSIKEEIPIAQTVETPIISETITPATVIDKNQTMVVNSIEETEILIQTEEVIIVEKPVILTENNPSTVEEILPIQAITSNTAVPTILPTETITTETIETNTTLNKETFDMSKGDADKGKNIFIKNFKDLCETQGSKFAGNHSQEEWEELAEEGKFEKRIFELCPKTEASYQKEWSPDLYQFYYENASDNEHIPEC